ncbi:oxygen-dependent protoporphyrinogen oxidase [Bacillus oleivorans]|uniref:Coproporphyrinogen III oxidase n=1 Tax=Bacillus oleivorans TaxID=1448271 RepID=A0A285CT81_9BACI|nr:protoporphyrinogen oxidase [Bacillus oleivorans]SNX70714.1 oxygen-dependent protoporphyrinogen oxidase [Bacillus oleivorans]
MKTILIIGGGITGLSAIYELHKWKKANRSDVKLILAEASDKLGGKIRTAKKTGFIMEEGADSIVARKENVMPFIEELGIEEEVVYNATGRSYLYTDGELKPIPADAVFGIPTSIESLAKTTLVSAEGKVEALKDFYTKNESFTVHDSIGDFLVYFLGKEFVEKQIAPVLSGVYSGKLSDLTIASTLPYVFEYKEQYGSIIKGLEANKDRYLSKNEKKFLSFKNGLSTLIQAIEDRLEDVDILKNKQASQIVKANNRYQVTFSDGETIETDYVVLSIPHNAAKSLLNQADLKTEFAQLQTSSLISVYIGFDIPDQQLPLAGTGFIAPNSDELSCNACTWTSRKWDHTTSKGNLLVRLFYKSSHPSFEVIKDMNKTELLQVALADIQKSLGINAEPVTSVVTSWSDNMPTYMITHPNTVRAIERKLAEICPGVLLAGCSYYGVGIPDCIENGKETAEKIINML